MPTNTPTPDTGCGNRAAASAKAATPGKDSAAPGSDAATLAARLAQRIHAADIRRICAQLQGNATMKQALYGLLRHSEPRVANNAAWVLTHLGKAEIQWLIPHVADLTDAVVSRHTNVKTGLLLTLLNALPSPATPRTDFLDFCLERINDPAEKGSVRALSIKLAHRLCRPYPELTAELRQHLELTPPELLPPAVKCARRNVLRLMRRQKG